MRKLFITLPLISVLFLAGCPSFRLPGWAGQHALRIAGAILAEYAPERDVIADSLIAALEQMAENIRNFQEIGVALEPTPADYRLEIVAALGEMDLPQEDIQRIMNHLFPPEPEIQAMALADYRNYERFIRRVADNLRE